jgi:hypothetical protein
MTVDRLLASTIPTEEIEPWDLCEVFRRLISILTKLEPSLVCCLSRSSCYMQFLTCWLAGGVMQRSTWTLYSPGQGSTRIRRRIDGESWGANYFFTVDFLVNPLKLCVVNSSNTWVLIVLIFVEFLSSYLLSGCRIQNVRSAPQNARTTSYSIHCTRGKRWAWFDISPVFTDFSLRK